MGIVDSSELVTDFSGGMITWLVVYSILFIAGITFIGLYRKKTNIEKNIALALLTIIVGITFAIKIVISNKEWAFDTDINCFTAWSNSACNGLTNFYNSASFCDYPPLYIYILAFFGLFTKLGIPAIISVRLPALISEIVIGIFIYKFSEKKLGRLPGLILCGLWLCNPLTIMDCAIWGQMDAVLAAIIIAAIYFLEGGKYIPSAALFTASILIKPQGLFFVPVFIFVILKRREWLQLLWSAITVIIVTLIVIMPFNKSSFIPSQSAFIDSISTIGGRDFWLSLAEIPVFKDILWLGNLYTGTAGTYNYTSLNMANVWSMLGLNLSTDDGMLGSMSYSNWGIIFIIGVLGIISIYLLKSDKEDSSWFGAAFLNVGIVMLATRMHERYMFPVVALLFVTFIFSRDWITPLLVLGFTITNYLNISDVLIRNITLNYCHIDPKSPQLAFVSTTNTILLGIMLIMLVYNMFGRNHLLRIQKLGVAVERGNKKK